MIPKQNEDTPPSIENNYTLEVVIKPFPLEQSFKDQRDILKARVIY
jgi:hypothetical protein